MGEDYKCDKITRILILYKQLCDGVEVDKASFCIEHGISERSFDRDIEDIRLFLNEIYSGDDVIYDKKENYYYLKNERPVFIDRMDATVIAKTLISSRTFSNMEMEGLLDVILSTVNKKDRKAIQNYLFHDVKDYSSENQTAILKILGDLYEVIDDGVGIELRYMDGLEKNISVAPMEIFFENQNFYLVAAVKNKLDDIRRFEIRRIISFIIRKDNDVRKLRFEYLHNEHVEGGYYV